MDERDRLMDQFEARPAPTPPAPADVAGEMAAWMAGGGILTMMLFPLALPLIALLAVSALPLLLLPLAAALIAVPILLVRALGRRIVRALRRPGTADRGVKRAARAAG